MEGVGFFVVDDFFELLFGHDLEASQHIGIASAFAVFVCRVDSLIGQAQADAFIDILSQIYLRFGRTDPHYFAVTFVASFGETDDEPARVVDRHHELFEATVAGYGHFAVYPEVEGQQMALFVEIDRDVGMTFLDFRIFECVEKTVVH